MRVRQKDFVQRSLAEIRASTSHFVQAINQVGVDVAHFNILIGVTERQAPFVFEVRPHPLDRIELRGSWWEE